MAKKDKQAKPGKGAKEKRPKDATARFLGALAGLPLLMAAAWMLFRGEADFIVAGQLAIGGLLLALVVEKGVVPLGRFIMNSPRE